ncbi:response regulator (plasmid) [Paraburkholderia sp. PREW-6R]|uniref:response regulator transcription factor n=1 Tax=Paraburkholderia sp. PREW-6R TaxID=3141544 RepID=UPI0031F5549B
MSSTYPVLQRPSPARQKPPSPTVFIVDDDISVRESLESLIQHEGIDVKTFVSATSFLEHAPSTGPTCLLLDVSMPGLNGLDLQKSLIHDRPAMPIIFVTGHEDARTVVQAMKAGAIEFLTKPFDDQALLIAVRGAIERSSSLLRKEHRKAEINSRYNALTRRERQVYVLIVEGLLNREIGHELGISEITVKAHRGQVMRKMEAESLAELVRLAGEAGSPDSNGSATL